MLKHKFIKSLTYVQKLSTFVKISCAVSICPIASTLFWLTVKGARFFIKLGLHIIYHFVNITYKEISDSWRGQWN